jgi:hypothetical protein
MDPISPLHLLLRLHLFHSFPFLFSFQELRHRQELWQGTLFRISRALLPQRSRICFPPSMASLSKIPQVRHLLHSLFSATLFLYSFMPSLFFFLQSINNLGGPWWFIQLWLNTYMHKAIGLDLRKISFPSESYAEGQPIQLRRCTSFGEATIMITNDTFGVTDFFRCFYNGFADEAVICFAYHDDNHDFENPVKFQLDNWIDDKYATNSLQEAIAPRILPARFTSGRSLPSYEFYHFFANKIQARDTIKSGLIYNRLKDLELDASTIDLSNWLITPITSVPFTKWWSEWQDHLFYLSASIYCKNLDADYIEPEDEVCTFPKFFSNQLHYFL